MKLLTSDAVAAAAAKRTRTAKYDALRTCPRDDAPALSREEQFVIAPVLRQCEALPAEGEALTEATFPSSMRRLVCA